MMEKSKNRRVLLGSVLAGLMVAAPGLSVTTGNFFQTVELEVGYRIAQAEDEKKAEVKEGEKPKPSPSPTAKAKGAGKCGAGACG